METKKKKAKVPKGVKTVLKGPVLIAYEGRGNKGRLPRKSDAGTYVDRWILGRRWRICVQPCWVGSCSPRKRIQEQSGKDLEFQKRCFIRCAGQFKKVGPIEQGSDVLSMLEWGKPVTVVDSQNRVESDKSWGQEIAEDPYFLRPEFYSSGRARPETIRNWRIEEELSNPKEGKAWRTVAEGRRARHEAGRLRFKKARSIREGERSA
jgi:hypothetical protein